MDPYLVGLLLVVPALVGYTVVYALTRRRHRVAWVVTFGAITAIWVVAAAVTIPGSKASGICAVLSTVGTGPTECPGPHMPTLLLYVLGFFAIVGLASITRPKSATDSPTADDGAAEQDLA